MSARIGLVLGDAAGVGAELAAGARISGVRLPEVSMRDQANADPAAIPLGSASLFDAVVSMYHDQGQIAMKLLGFAQGVTLLGGLPVPVTTPAQGTAYDIAGLGLARPDALRQAFVLAAAMGAARATVVD